MVSIELENLTKTFESAEGTIVAVDDLELTIDDGEFFTLVGPSGCGKTTTLRMMAGLENPSKGRILFDGEDVTNLAPQSRDIAMVFQNVALFPHMTCKQNIGYGLKVRGETERMDERIQETAELLSIADQLDKHPDQLSGGQQQRVALGRAIIRNPGAILFDEPMSDLDAKLKAELRVVVQELQQEYETTMVYVTHDQKEAMTMSDRIGVMNSGRFEQVGTPEAIYNNPANEFVGRFIGEPSMNIVKGIIQDGAIKLEEDPGAAPLTADASAVDDIAQGVMDGTVQVGFRPAHAKIKSGATDALLETTFLLSEPNGEEYIIYLDRDGQKITVISESKPSFEEGETVGIEGLEKYYIFDARSGTTIEGRSPTVQGQA